MKTVTISLKLFLTTTLLAFSLESAWLIHESRHAVDPESIPIMLALACPLLLAVGCAVGFVIAAAHGILRATLSKRAPGVASLPTLDPQKRALVIRLLLSGCFATSLSLVLENQTHLLHKLPAVGGEYVTFVLWWLMFALSAIVLRRVQGFLSRRGRKESEKLNDVES